MCVLNRAHKRKSSKKKQDNLNAPNGAGVKIMETKNLTALLLSEDGLAKEKLMNLPRWGEAKSRLLGILETAEKGTVEEFFGPKVSGKGAPMSFQALANLTFTSAGYVRDKWVRYESEAFKVGTRPSVYDFICKNLVPLSPEELKALAEKQKHEAEVTAKAVSYLETCELNDITVTAEAVQKNTKLLTKFGEEVVNKIIELLMEE